MASNWYSKISILFAVVLVSYLTKECHGENPETSLSSNETVLSLADNRLDVGTARSPKVHPFGGLIFDFVITPFLNAVVTVLTVGAGGFLSVLLNLGLAVVRNFGTFIVKVIYLYFKAHTLGWGWEGSHHGWELPPPQPPPIYYGWKRDLGGSGNLGF